MWQILTNRLPPAVHQATSGLDMIGAVLNKETIRVAKGPEENWATLAAPSFHRSQSLVEYRDVTVLLDDT